MKRNIKAILAALGTLIGIVLLMVSIYFYPKVFTTIISGIVMGTMILLIIIVPPVIVYFSIKDKGDDE